MTKYHYRYSIHNHSTSTLVYDYYGTERGLLLKLRRCMEECGITGYRSYAIIANLLGHRARYSYNEPINKQLTWE